MYRVCVPGECNQAWLASGQGGGVKKVLVPKDLCQRLLHAVRASRYGVARKLLKSAPLQHILGPFPTMGKGSRFILAAIDYFGLCSVLPEHC